MYIDGWVIGRKKWYRESQIFKVRQAHPRTILAKVTPLSRLIVSLIGELLSVRTLRTNDKYYVCLYLNHLISFSMMNSYNYGDIDKVDRILTYVAKVLLIYIERAEKDTERSE